MFAFGHDKSFVVIMDCDVNLASSGFICKSIRHRLRSHRPGFEFDEFWDHVFLSPEVTMFHPINHRSGTTHHKNFSLCISMIPFGNVSESVGLGSSDCSNLAV